MRTDPPARMTPRREICRRPLNFGVESSTGRSSAAGPRRAPGPAARRHANPRLAAAGRGDGAGARPPFLELPLPFVFDIVSDVATALVPAFKAAAIAWPWEAKSSISIGKTYFYNR